jgi:hypothetical protein
MKELTAAITEALETVLADEIPLKRLATVAKKAARAATAAVKEYAPPTPKTAEVTPEAALKVLSRAIKNGSVAKPEAKAKPKAKTAPATTPQPRGRPKKTTKTKTAATTKPKAKAPARKAKPKGSRDLSSSTSEKMRGQKRVMHALNRVEKCRLRGDEEEIFAEYPEYTEQQRQSRGMKPLRKKKKRATPPPPAPEPEAVLEPESTSELDMELMASEPETAPTADNGGLSPTASYLPL